jgi:hypothetical protein
MNTNEHESVHSSEGMILPTNHTNRRERNSGAKITKAFRVFGVFRGQIAYLQALAWNRHHPESFRGYNSIRDVRAIRGSPLLVVS